MILVSLCAAPVWAAIPCDTDGNNRLSEGEFVSAAFAYLDITYRNGSGECPDRNDLRDAAYVLRFWGGAPHTCTDGMGQSVVFERPPGSVVVFSSTVLDTMRAIGVPMAMVSGVADPILMEVSYFPGVANCPAVGDLEGPDEGTIASIAPDLVIVPADASGNAAAAAAAACGVPVVRFSCTSPGTIRDEIDSLGLLFVREKGADDLIAFIDAQESAVATCLAGLGGEERVQVYAEDAAAYTAAGAGTPLGDLVSAAGGVVVPENSGWCPVTDGEVVAAAPGVMIKMVGHEPCRFGGFGDRISLRFIEVRNAIGLRPGWTTVPAVDSGAVYLIHSSVVEGPQFGIGLQYIARWLYPERCRSLDPADLQARYFSDFCGLEGGSGMYVFPEAAQ
ncbi:ABC transporter substrate-binding protein [Methanofollis fontis]|uniref:Fe/B12 periplasmic-binding domain-containing protein n=1 Tax=Methanofollis fontis TaxID=2052832 RepID=A0A483CUM1_9EURY|nr:ABC transporter substrate-binding protein [Methanofollis fontis]TAJ45316.1 hypothetical protein CUJ86_00785 [Methanofollis fontis]